MSNDANEYDVKRIRPHTKEGQTFIWISKDNWWYRMIVASHCIQYMEYQPHASGLVRCWTPIGNGPNKRQLDAMTFAEEATRQFNSQGSNR